ncbi:LysR family transcriptional regulator [Arthrobacter ramosus]|uniref:LysR family transcriptional regulator n=1 Tax=Arthrobacter ramosus TaxID=1672 RepID=A0ABV5XT36_ARTRM|nr:LysR family transcriptional regulator [Arthrobacter ramosus]
MDLRGLQYFVSSADAGSFTAAADVLYVSQPSLSEGIRRLERELATPLFHRVGKGVVLTESGLVLLPMARNLLRDLDEAREAMVALKGLQGGHVRLTSPPGLSVDPLAQIVGRFRDKYPAVTLSMLPAEDGNLATQAVLSAACEIGIVDRQPHSSDLVAHVIARNEIMVISPPGTGHEEPTQIPLEALTGRSFISSLPGTRTRTVLNEARESGIDLRIVVETPHREAVVPLVLEGVGSAFVTSSVAREAQKQGAVASALQPQISYDVYLIHRSKPLTRAAAAFVSHALLLSSTTMPQTPET